MSVEPLYVPGLVLGTWLGPGGHPHITEGQMWEMNRQQPWEVMQGDEVGWWTEAEGVGVLRRLGGRDSSPEEMIAVKHLEGKIWLWEHVKLGRLFYVCFWNPDTLAYISKIGSGNTGEESQKAKISWTSVEGRVPEQRGKCKVKGPCSQTSSVSTDTTWDGAFTCPRGYFQFCGEGRMGFPWQRRLDSERFHSRVFQSRDRFQTAFSSKKSRDVSRPETSP